MTNGLAILGGYGILLVLIIVLLGFLLRRDPGDKSNTTYPTPSSAVVSAFR